MTLVRSSGSTRTSNCRQPGSLREWAAFSTALGRKLSTFSGLMRRSTDRTNMATPFRWALRCARDDMPESGHEEYRLTRHRFRATCAREPVMGRQLGPRPRAARRLRAGGAEFLALADRGARARAIRSSAPARAPGRDSRQRGPLARAFLFRRGAV